MKKLAGVVIALLVAFTANAAWVKTGDPPQAAFTATGTGGLKMQGTTNEVELLDDGKTLLFTVQLANLTTGIGLRDRHMREKYLDVKKFPTATLSVPIASLQAPAPGKPTGGTATGAFTVHGVTKQVPFTYTASCGKPDACDVAGEIPIDIRQFGIVIPSYLGITVKPDITVFVSMQAKPQ